MNYQPLLNQAEAYVKKYISEHDNPFLLYHNLGNTQNIVNVASQLAKYYLLIDKELFVINSAAWFLHLGYYKDVMHPGEANINLAEHFLKNSGIDEDIIYSVKNCILATEEHNTPHSLLEEIVCDANTYYFGTENFSEYNKLRRKEFELINNTKIDKNEWRQKTIQLLESHKYYTDYCKKHLDKNKTETLERLKQKVLEMPPVNPITSVLPEQPGKSKKDDSQKSKKGSPQRTIETMFRTTSSNSQRLSNQADTKAHILISVNAIIISVVLTILIRRMDEYSNITIPIIILMLVNLVTIIFAILATRPNIPKGIFNPEDLEKNKVNLLFFGNFFKMNFEEYSSSMFKVMDDKNFLYVNLLRNLHEQGIVLSRKYRMLKTAYNVFMFGLVISVVSFFISFYFLERTY
jgi:predicted metal-dependent HD superfamily phosphohydrolase